VKKGMRQPGSVNGRGVLPRRREKKFPIFSISGARLSDDLLVKDDEKKS